MAMAASPRYVRHELATETLRPRDEGRYYALFLWFLASLVAVPLLDNLGLLWVAIEATTIVSALLVGITRTPDAIEAAWKYLVLGTVGVGFALLGTLFAYASSVGFLGESSDALNWTRLVSIAPMLDPGLMRLAFVFALAGYGTKIGLVPFHTWLPDAHSQAPSPISALLSGVSLAAALYALVRFQLVAVGSLGPEFASTLLIVFGLLSLAVALPFMVAQEDLKRLLAYSSIEHMGLLVLGIGFGGPIALLAVGLHLGLHAVVKATPVPGGRRARPAVRQPAPVADPRDARRGARRRRGPGRRGPAARRPSAVRDLRDRVRDRRRRRHRGPRAGGGARRRPPRARVRRPRVPRDAPAVGPAGIRRADRLGRAGDGVAARRPARDRRDPRIVDAGAAGGGTRGRAHRVSRRAVAEPTTPNPMAPTAPAAATLEANLSIRLGRPVTFSGRPDEPVVEVSREEFRPSVESLVGAGGRHVMLLGIDRRGIGAAAALAVEEVVAIPAGPLVRVRAALPPAAPSFPSLTPLLPAAQWDEREARDLFGIVPVGHPDPRPPRPARALAGGSPPAPQGRGGRRRRHRR